MPYFTIHYTADGQPYLIQKNYGHKPEKEDSSSHWTWHITRDGVEHLARNNVLNPGRLPTYINEDELEDLKAYNMLARVNGERIGNRGLYPSDDKAWQRRMSEMESAAENRNNSPSRKTKQLTKSATEKPLVIRIGSEHGIVPKGRSDKLTGKTKGAHTRSGRKSRPLVVEVEPETEEQPQGFWAAFRSLFGKR